MYIHVTPISPTSTRPISQPKRCTPLHNMTLGELRNGENLCLYNTIPLQSTRVLAVLMRLRRYWYIVDLRLPVCIHIVSQMSAGSAQSVEGTRTTAGDSAKLVRMSSPPSTAAEGTLMALAT